MQKPIRVHILNREYTLRVAESDVNLTREIAAELDERMQAFRKDHPTQPEITAAVITALALAQDLHSTREQLEELQSDLEEESTTLVQQLDAVLGS